MNHDTQSKPGSTSWHGLNADRGLSKPNRLRWLLLNLVNNLFPNRGIDPSLELSRFRADPSLVGAQGGPRELGNSPSRVLGDQFWHAYPWGALAESLGGRIRVLEVGCGSGLYGTLLESLLGGTLERYTGIDIKPHADWERLGRNPKFRLEVGDAGTLAGHLREANLIVTQSALEHFDADLQFFRQLAEHVRGSEAPLAQIHVMPSAACLSTFLWHGVRQYTPRTVSKITSLFGSGTRKTLFALGAGACNRVHRNFITYPMLARRGDFRRSKPAEYRAALEAAIGRDNAAPAGGEACFYALVLQSGPRGEGRAADAGRAAGRAMAAA